MTCWLVWETRLVWVIFNDIGRSSHNEPRRPNHSSALRNKTFRGGAKMEALFKITLLAVEYEVGLGTFSYRTLPHRFW